MTPLLIYLNLFKFPNSGCGLSASAAYTPVFTVSGKQGIDNICKGKQLHNLHSKQPYTLLSRTNNITSKFQNFLIIIS